MGTSLHDHEVAAGLNPTWARSDRLVPRRVVRPILAFLELEVAGAVLMLAAAVAALAWANSPWAEGYERLWETHLTIDLGGLLHLDHSLRHWVNDALMVIFFFVVGLEIKRELVRGELRDPRAAALPALAALGGMVVPAGLYLAFNAGGPAAGGWGIPMATDIAFAVGVVTLAGRWVPLGAKLFLLALAIVDDLGAIVVIALFYSDGLSLGWLAAAAVGLAVIVAMRRVHIRWVPAYVAVGAGVWLATLESGVHATLAGVALALLTPAEAFHRPDRARPVVYGLAATEPSANGSGHGHGPVAWLAALTRVSRETAPPLDRLEHALAPWSAYVVVPLFALANAGVHLSGAAVGAAVTDPVVIGVFVGLVVGKVAGITAATWLAVRSGLGRLPSGTTWRHVVGLGLAGGIGFTVALFVTTLAFADPAVADRAKVGIFAASLVAGLAAFWVLRGARAPAASPPPPRDVVT